eukprot:CAMPEP_0171356720 /NCGR_PEP_ID=MMETSP0878-20121228/45873_1 /TAXON_ID=67004 /ORGANISM="Thalassiosira weissflogii, Strain CCMP1336" /LENGTH=35 /DNA_ID= /DNA_START= /DNA_END= /DNA_ORIENTATION=
MAANSTSIADAMTCLMMVEMTRMAQLLSGWEAVVK